LPFPIWWGLGEATVAALPVVGYADSGYHYITPARPTKVVKRWSGMRWSAVPWEFLTSTYNPMAVTRTAPKVPSASIILTGFVQVERMSV